MTTHPPTLNDDSELDLDDKTTYDIYHIVGAVANECHASGLLIPEAEAEMAVLPDFEGAVKEIIDLIHQRDEVRDIQSRIDEIGRVRLTYGHHTAETFVNGKFMTTQKRYEDLKNQLTKLKKSNTN